MTVHKLSAGDGYTYLTRQVASADQQRAAGQDLAGYYIATGTPPGRWMGAGAADLGVSGQVSEAQMVALFGKGLHPDSESIVAAEEALGASPREASRAASLGKPFPVYADSARRAVAGYDLVFTPVKSVSVLWALGKPQVRAEVEAAHRDAVADVLGWLEAEAAYTRLGDGGIAQVDTHGLIAAGFDHRDSRLGDPDLHTHVAISNKVRAVIDHPDGTPRWVALDGRALFHAGVAASERYNTRLEDAMAHRLGVDFAERPDTGPSAGRDKRPVRELVGVPTDLVKGFSRRREVIEDRYAHLSSTYQRNHGRGPDTKAALALAQQATLDTRTAKQQVTAFADQLAGWRRRAVDLASSRTVESLAATVTGRRGAWVDGDRVDVHGLAAQVVARVETDRSTWTRWNVLAEVERACRPLRLATDAVRDQVVEQVQQLATGPQLSIRIAAPALVDDPEQLRRSDGTSVYVAHGAERFTTQSILDAEQHLLAAAAERTGHAVDCRLVEQAVTLVGRHTGHWLDPGQQALVHAFCADDRRLLVGIGPAGSGKTTAMRAACAGWDAAGRRVVPLATSAKYAQVLAADLGRPAENLHKYLHDHTATTSTSTDADAHADSTAGSPPRAGDVVLVDEAGMAATRRLQQLVAHAQQHGAVVRLVGDPAQLSAVESGGALRLLAAETDPIELTCLHRFADPAEADATLGLRHGDQEALDFYEQRDRVRSGGTEAMVDAAFAGWRADTLAGQVSVMGAADTATVVGLSARARVDRIARGAVHPDGVALHDGNRAGVGDWVVTRANDRLATVFSGRDFVKNGDLWTVTARHRDGSLTAQHLGHGGLVRLAAGYVAADVELGYATTAHRVQGGTVDTAHPVITAAMSREALYVLASRARQQTTLYVGTDEPCDPAADPAPAPPRTGRDVLEQVLRREAAEKSATETIRDALGQPHRLPTLVAAYEHSLSVAPAAAIDTHRQMLLDAGRWRPLPWITIAGSTSTPGDDLADTADTGRTGQVGDLDVWVAALNDRAGAITTRVDRLTDRVAATSSDTSRAQVLAAAYREQFHVHPSPGSPIGPVPEPRSRQQHAYQHVLAADRRPADQFRPPPPLQAAHRRTPEPPTLRL